MNDQFRSTELTVSLSTLANNARVLKRTLRHRARMMAVVKADAYGHGLLTEVSIALKNGADALSVALLEEGIALREHGLRAPILMMGGIDRRCAAAAVERHIAVALYDEELLAPLSDAAAKLDTVAHVHLKIDTGMNRVGVRGEALTRLLHRMRDHKRVKCEGVFTHFADARDEAFTRLQDQRFRAALAQVRAEGYSPIAHAAASASALRDEALWHDMVRLGIALYGGAVRDLNPELMPAQRLTARPVRLSWIEAGEPVGYGMTYRPTRDTLVATLPIGYGDGYPRMLSNTAPVLVRGRRAPLIGRVCMDMIMVDVTDVPGASMGDEYVLLGDQFGERITPDELAELCGTIPYEIMLGFSARVPRRVTP